MKLMYQNMVSIFRDRPIQRVWAWILENKAVVAMALTVLIAEAFALALFFSAGFAAATALCGFAFSFMWLCYVISIGTELGRTPDGAVGKAGRAEDHVFYVRLMLVTLLVGVVAIEVAVRKAGGLWGPWWLMLIHFTMVASSALTLVSTLVFNGVADKERHRVWAPRFAWSYLGTIATGTTLLVLRFPIW
jgi:hypothetical protein